jgi:LysM repeat protein
MSKRFSASTLFRPMKHSLTRWHPVLLLMAVLLWPVVAGAMTPYKTYVIRQYEDQDILCDPYTVQKGDYIWELLKRRGRIADEDFPRFVLMLKQINPHIRDVDKIYPGQEIFIPLKEVMSQREPEPEQPSQERVLTIPIIPDVLYSTYTVQQGDYLYDVVSRHHGIEKEQIPEGYFSTLKKINPDVQNLNRIYPGQKIRIPDLVSRKSQTEDEPGMDTAAVEPPPEPEPPADELAEPDPKSTVARAMKALGGNVTESGSYFFPLQSGKDLELNLSTFPVITMADGHRLLLETGESLPAGAESVIRAYWDPLTIVRTKPGESRRSILDKIFRTLYGKEVWRTLDMPPFDDGMQATLRGDWVFALENDESSPKGFHCITLIENPGERTSVFLKDYLAEKNIRVSDVLVEGADESEETADRTLAVSDAAPTVIPDASDQVTFINEFARAIGFTYDRLVPVTFHYAGFQVDTAMDTIHGKDGFDAIIDFGTLYGDSKSAIEATGLRVVSIKPEDPAMAIAQNVLTSVGMPLTESPVFFAADRNVFKSISLAIPGLLASSSDQGKMLVTEGALSSNLSRFLAEKEIRVVQIGEGQVAPVQAVSSNSSKNASTRYAFSP